MSPKLLQLFGIRFGETILTGLNPWQPIPTVSLKFT